MPLHRQCPMFDVSESTGSLSGPERDRVPAVLLEPEVAVEPRLQLVGELRCGERRPPVGRAGWRSRHALDARRRRSPAPRTVPAAPRRPGRRGSGSRRPESFQPWLARATIGGLLVLDVAVAVAVAVLAPSTSRARSAFGSKLAQRILVEPPPTQLAEQHDEQRRGVDRSVVRVATGQRRRVDAEVARSRA